MPKFENSQYAKLWDSSEGRLILSKILANPDLIRANHMFWASKFRIDQSLTPTDEQGRATFISEMREQKQGHLMDMRAPMSHNTQIEKGGLKYYTGVIPSFSPKQYRETASEREYKEKLFEQFGDASLIAEYATETLQYFVDSGNQTLSRMSAQLLSDGKIVVDWGEGIKGGVLKADIPAENFIKGGTAAWTDTNFALLDRLREIVEKLKLRWGLTTAWQLEISRDKFNNTFLKNKQVIDWIKLQYQLKNNFMVIDNTNVPSAVVTTEYALECLKSFDGLPVISIIDEKENDINLGTVSGWVAKNAVIRPLGYAGYIRRSEIIERNMYTKYGNNTIKKTFAYAMQNLGLVINTELNNGELKEWQSEFVMNAIPSLDEFLMHYIIDTTDGTKSGDDF
jgi:hypothetical protein